MAEQILTVDVDWTSKSGSSDSTIAFGEQFTLNIKGMKAESLKQDKHSLRLMLLTQSVPEDDNVVWENGNSNFTVAEDGTVIVAGLKINTQAVLDALNQQGGKSRLYLAVTEMSDGAPFTDYGTSRLTVSLGSFIEDPSYDPPETVDVPKFSDIKNLFDQVKADIDAIGDVETRVNAVKEAVEADKVAVATLASKAQTAASTATSAANSANALASRAEEAQRIAVNASENVSNMQDEIGATKTKIDATAKVVQANADAVAGAKKEIDTAIAAASTALDGKVKQAEDAATAADGSAKAADKSRQDAEAAKGNAAESAKNAATSAEQAESAKTAIGDVGGRLQAVETSVAEKVPYLSDNFKKRFNVSQQYNIADNGQKVMNPCHKGWICSASHDRNSKDFDYYIAPNGTVTKTSVAVFKNESHSYKAHLVYTDKTIIYSENYRNEKIKCTIDDSGVTCEKLTAFPANVASYTGVFGIINSHGFIVTTGGVILKGDTLAEVDGVTFYAINTSTAVISKRGDCLLGKNGDTYYYFDQGQKRWCKLVTDENGTPTITVNTNYTQNVAFKFAPLSYRFCFLATDGDFFRGISNGDNGHIYDSRRRLNMPINAFLSVGNGDVIVFIGDKILLTRYSTQSDSIITELGANVFYKCYWDKGLSFSTVLSYNRFSVVRDYSGNIIVAMFSVYHWGANQPFHILTEK